MKVCIYLEMSGILDHSGIGSAVRQQKKALALRGVEVTDDPRGDYDIIHINSIGPKSYLYSSLAHLAGRKVVTHAHCTHADFADSFRGSTAFSPILKRYLVRLFNKSDIVIAPTPFAKQIVEASGVTTPIEVVSNGVDLNALCPSEALRKEYREKYHLQSTTFFSVGHVFERKGFSTFCDSAEKLPEYQFVWFGPIYSRLLVPDSITKRMKTVTPNVSFTGFVEDINGVYSAGDIFFFASRVETQGLALLEAIACRTPVLIRDIPAFDWLEHEYDCFKAKSDEEFIQYARILAEDLKLRVRIAERAHRKILDHSLQEVGRSLESIYSRLSVDLVASERDVA